jgi:type II secretory ATPase GspE/PulE/Tfp pilus assembly ATPase PilB-like protein
MEYREQILKALGDNRDVDIKQIRFLELLLAEGKLKPREIKGWVEDARKRSLPYPTLALSRGLVDQSELADLLARQFNLLRLDPSEEQIDMGRARSIKDADIHATQAIPVRYDDETQSVVVVTYLPENPKARERMPVLLSLQPEQITWALCSRDEFASLRARVAARESSEEEVIEVDIRAGETEDDLAARHFVEGMILEGQRRRASDIHFQPGEDQMLVRMRIDKDLVNVQEVPADLQANIVSVIKNMANMDQAETYRSQDGHIIRDFGKGPIDIRAATMRTKDGEEVELRLMDPRTRRMGLDELGIAPDPKQLVTDAIRRQEGLIVVSGATGAGKTTTLYAMLEQMDDPTRKIITIEDPVELRLPNASQIEVNLKRGISFTNTVENILRNDPDIIMVGEVRKAEEALTAVAAAETGHLVLTSMHARSAAGVINRLIKMGIDPALISYALLMVTHQRLVKRLCPHCNVEVSYSREELEALGAPDSAIDKAKKNSKGKYLLRTANERGCDYCIHGYLGLLGIHEIVVIDDEIRLAIDSGSTATQIKQLLAARPEQRLLIDDFYEKVLAGLTSPEERKRLL